MNQRFIRFISVWQAFLFVSLLLLQLVPEHAGASANSKTYLIGFKNSEKATVRAIQRSSVQQLSSKVIVAKLTESERQAMAQDQNVAYIEEDSETELAATDLAQTQQVPWGIAHIGANAARNKQYMGKNIKIGILDTGISSHPDLEVKGGVSYIEDEPGYSDHHGHGTAVAGVIAGKDNDFGIVGVAPEADIYAIKVLDKKGHGTYSGMIQGIEWAIQNKLNIISISAGGYIDSRALRDQIKRANDHGLLVIAAAGNRGIGEETELFPAQYAEVLSVGAIDRENQRADFSSVGKGLDLMAPGVDIMSTSLGGEYQTRSGTSLAAPHVAGAAAVIWSEKGQTTNREVRELLTESATPLGESRFYGKGLLNLEAALGQEEEADSEIEALQSSVSELPLTQGESRQLKVTAKRTDGTVQDVTEQASYTSEDEQIAKVNRSGLVSGIGTGETKVIAQFAGKTLEISVTVREAAPLTPLGGLDRPENGELVSGLYEGKGWYLDPAGVAQIRILVDGVPVGEAQYGDPRPDLEAKYPAYQNAHAGFHFSLDTREMTPGAHTLAVAIDNTLGEQTLLEGTTFYIGDSPVSEGLQADVKRLELALRKTHQLLISTVLQDQTVKDVTALATYASSDEGVAAVSDTGLVQAIGAGTATVTVSYEDKTLSIPVHVKTEAALIARWEVEKPADQATVAGMTLVEGWYLDPAGVSKIAIELDGERLGDARTGLARPDIETAYPEYENPQAGFQYAFDTTKVQEGPHVLKVTAVSNDGSERMLAEWTVLVEREEAAASIVANTSKIELTQGKTQQLGISAMLQDQRVKDVTKEASYTVENPALASVSPTGLVTGLEPGQTTITVHYQTHTLALPVQVKAAAELAQGGIDSPQDNATISGVYPVTGWFFASSGVASVEVLVDGVVAGEATYGIARPEVEITDVSVSDRDIGFQYSLDTGQLLEGTHTIAVRGTGKDGKQTMIGTRSVQVVQLLPATALSVNDTELRLPQGKNRQLAVMAVLADQSKHDVTKLALYTVDNASVAKVSPEGLVTAVAQGTTNVTIRYGELSVQIPVTVTESEPLQATGELETPVNGAIVQGSTTVAGWFLTSAPVTRYDVLLDGTVIGIATPGIARPDIALLYPDYENSHAGFSYALDLSGLQAGEHTVAVIAVDQEGKQHPLPEKRFVVGQTAPVLRLQYGEQPVALPKAASKSLSITAILEDQNARDVTGEAVYAHEHADVIHVSPLGVVTGLKVGMAKVVASYGGQTVTIPVVVTETEAESQQAKGQLELPFERAVIGGTTTLQGWILDPAGIAKVDVLVDGQFQGTAEYGEPRPDIAALYPHYRQANAGFRYLLDTLKFSEGAHKVTVRATNKEGVESVVLDREVTIGPVAALTANLNSIELEKDKTVALQLTATHRDGSTKDVTAEAVYAIQDALIAKVDSSGLVTALASGNTTMTVSFAGIVLTIPVQVKGEGASTGGAIDTPADQEVVSGQYNVTGWFVPAGELEKVEVLLDGQLLGEATYGLDRPDVLRTHPESKEQKPGFAYLLQADQQPTGEHKLTVLVTEKDGKQTSMEKAITIVESIPDTYTYWLQFSNQQGKNNWSYLEANGERYTELVWNAETEEWKSEQGDTAIGNTWLKVGGSEPVIRWEAPRSGKILVSGWASMIDLNEGDGVNVRILKNDGQIWPASGWQSIEHNDEIGVEFAEELEVEAGDKLSFQVNAKETEAGDLLKWTPEIRYLSTEIQDNAAPQVYLTTPVAGKVISEVSGEDVIILSGQVLDPNIRDQVSVWYQIDDQEARQIALFTASEQAHSFLYHVPVQHLNPDDLYALKVWAVDQKAQKSQVEKLDFRLDMRAQAKEKDPIYIDATWKTPRNNAEFSKGQKVMFTWEYINATPYNRYYDKITGQELTIYIRQSGMVTRSIKEKLSAQARSYEFDTSSIVKNATVEAQLRTIMGDVPSFVEGSTTKVNFSVMTTNQPPMLEETNLVTIDGGLTGHINYTIKENDVTDVIVAKKIRVGFTPGGNELGEKMEVVPEKDQVRRIVERYRFPITQDMLFKTVYWTAQAQDNRGAWTEPEVKSARMVDVLPNLVVFTPAVKQTIDVSETFTLEGTYTRMQPGEVLSGKVNPMNAAKKMTTTSTSGHWLFRWTGAELGQDTYKNIEVKSSSGSVALYYGVLTVEKKPGAPTIVNVEADATSIKVYWNPVAGAQNYGIRLDNNLSRTVESGTSYTFTGLQPSRVYTITLWAISPSGVSSYSSSITVETKPAEGNFTLVQENSPIRMHFPANQAKYFKIVAKTSGTYQFTLNNDSGSLANAKISVFRSATLQPQDQIAAGENGSVSAAFVAGKTYYLQIVSNSSLYATLLAKASGETIALNQAKEITIPAGQSVEFSMNAVVPGKYRMVTELKNPTGKYPTVTLLANGNVVTPKEKPSAAEVIYELATGTYTIRLTNTDSAPANIWFTVFAPLAGGTLYEYVYDQNNRITAIKENGAVSVSFTHDDNGNILKSVKQTVAPPPRATALKLDLDKVDLSSGGSKSIKVMATLENGSQVDVTAQVVYVVENPSVAYISNGLVYAVNGGTTKAQLYYGGQTKTLTITVQAPAVRLSSISLSPQQTTLTAGQIQRVYATAFFTDGSSKDVNSVASFQTSNPSVAQVSSQGVITGIAPGTATITASYDGKSASAQVVVQGAYLQELKATPAQLSLTAGNKGQLNIAATYSNGVAENVTQQAEYTSNSPAVASVESGGIVTARAEGTTQITVRYGGKSTTVSVTVSGSLVTLVSVGVHPQAVSIKKGATQQLDVKATYSDSSVTNITNKAVYQSAQPAIATVAASGVITGVAVGSTTVTITFEGKTVAVPVQITEAQEPVQSLTATPASLNLLAGKTESLQVTATYKDGKTADVSKQAAYVSQDPTVATVQADGLVTAVKPGSTSIQISHGGVSTSVPVTVAVENALVDIKLVPEDIALLEKATKQLVVKAVYADGTETDITDKAQYAVDDPSVATVSASGLLSAGKAGSATLAVEFSGKKRSVVVKVRKEIEAGSKLRTLSAGGGHTLMVKEDGTLWAWGQNEKGQLGDGTTQNRSTPVESMLVISAKQLAAAPSTVLLPPSQSKPLKVTATYANGSTQDVTTQATYESSHPEIAAVDATGVVTSGTKAGTATITIRYYDQTITVPIQVEEVSTRAKRLSAGGSHTLLVKEDGTMWAWGQNEKGQLGDGTMQNRSTPVKSMLVISAKQLAAAPSTVLLPPSQSKPLKVTATYANGSTQDVTTQATYESSHPEVAAVNATGVITAGGTPGTATITVRYYDQTITVPVQVKEVATQAKRLSAGGAHTLLVKQDGTVWAWGQNERGQLGDGTTQNRSTPVKSMLVISAKQLTAAPSTVLLPPSQSKPLKVTATYANGSTQDVTTQATYESSHPEIAAVNATGVITAGGTPGTATITIRYYDQTITVPVQVEEVSTRAKRLSAGGSHTLLVKEDGTVWAWGQNEKGQLGDGTTQNRSMPVESMLVISAKQLAAAPSTVLLPPSQSKPLKVTATYANGSTQDVTTQATYESSHPEVAAVNATGVITAGGTPGTATITIRYY
ncbi:Ig-like domain-containing protein, partial [Brevibacillus agri]|nr:Ig-like domain-containing protein [Brevibacillus agri]